MSDLSSSVTPHGERSGYCLEGAICLAWSRRDRTLEQRLETIAFLAERINSPGVPEILAGTLRDYHSELDPQEETALVQALQLVKGPSLVKDFVQKALRDTGNSQQSDDLATQPTSAPESSV